MNSKPLILVVDNEESRRDELSRILGDEFSLLSASGAKEAFDLLEEHSPDAVLVDLEADGIDFCRRLRPCLRRAETPIVVLSSLNDAGMRIQSFEAGADDYLLRPVDVDELRARMQIRIKRLRQLAAGHGEANVIVAGNLRLDLQRVEVKVGDKPVRLGQVEFKILALLARGLDQLSSREEIESFVWGERRPASRVLDPHINALRKKLAGSGLELRTFYGTGYALRVKTGLGSGEISTRSKSQTRGNHA
jgi:DNA-binding response OmpR family regulator